ncbi:ABC transporter ATP-binding protein [Peptostreptococcus canis]|uniref:ABC transporter ATP-binding protein n=1 Tax=Peptostreptococcus canis TaxID=1159213 RepID=A0ABR6TK03_9FIRM|nr:ABC transporter ATP-binding protein [Peptostreptococcus canis]MBC2575727.1 ABC transporter ATP-binding protein [Peptostreptococcus canis]MBP1998158.1 putative ABC transport system ATP-binding protein [Peptostreptococcus canis]
MSFIELKSCNKIYMNGEEKLYANNNVNLQIEKGELTVILGPSGAGKSTLLNILGGMDNVTSGEVIIDGEDISKYDDIQLTEFRRNNIGFVFQFYNLIQNLTAKENVEISNQLSDNPIDAERCLKLVGLGNHIDKFPAQMSGGEQQRVSIARAISKNPKLLLCDEPTGALDYKTGKNVLKVLQNISNEMGTNVIIVTHNTFLKNMADRVIYVNDGKISDVIVNEEPSDIDDITW